MKPDPILFVSHDAGPTGAPLLLLHLLRWIRAHTKLDFAVALKKTGSLESQFAELAPTTVFERAWQPTGALGLSRLVPDRIHRRLQHLEFMRHVGDRRFGVIYSNTLVNGRVLRTLRGPRCPVISHAHELDYMIRTHTAPDDLAFTLERTGQFIACSQTVADNLAANHGVDKSKIAVYGFIPMDDVDPSRSTESANRIRSELGISANAFVVGGAGTVDWRKGYDLFIRVALEARRIAPQREIHFVWVGGASDREIPLQIAYDLEKLDLLRTVHFVGHRGDFPDFLAMFDCFCVTSREDPFPLVMLEAALAGKPILCFDRAGGSAEFVESDCGFVVPYLDVPAMAVRIAELIDNPSLRAEFGHRAKAKVRARHDMNVFAPKIAELIGRCASEST